MANTVSPIRPTAHATTAEVLAVLDASGPVEVTMTATGYRASVSLGCPTSHPPTGTESPPRSIHVQVVVYVASTTDGAGYVRPELRRDGKVLGGALHSGWGARDDEPGWSYRTWDVVADTGPLAVVEALAVLAAIDAAALEHQVARAAAVAAEDARYAVALRGGL